MLFSRKISNPEKFRYDGEDHDEEILYVLRRSLITTIPSFVLIFIMLIVPIFAFPNILEITYQGVSLFSFKFVFMFTLFWYLLTFGIFFEMFLLWYFNVFVITNKKIVDIDFLGLLYKNISETTLRNIEDVTSKVSGVLGVIFNIGTLSIQTAGEQREFEFEKLDNPSGIRDVISDMVANHRGHDHNN